MEAAYNFIFEHENDDILENLELLDNIVRRPKTYKERRDYFEEYDDVDFRTRFRLSKESCLDVLQMIEDKLEYPSNRNKSISPINQLLLTLRYYATGSQQITMGDYCGMSKSTSHRIIHRVTVAIASLEERLYNESQIRSRNPIERLFGIWKRRFPVLALGIQVQLKNCLPIIVATAVLHNILIKAKEELPSDDPEIQLPAPWDDLIEQGHIREHRHNDNINRDINPVRRSLINNYFKSLHLQSL
ncbi:unnamed protein product [Parnassius mnemosyne]|uniref:Nuclease HARBI1 n=1 Tax=Parnassius mnemosyne TaxID=213953 RepID=A0AAV1M8R0_9NEOP